MGLFDMFTTQGKLQRHARKMADPYTQPEDREAAARWLADEGSDAAILGLLGRFDVSASNQLKDRAEKDHVLELLVGLGGKVGGPLRQWLGRCKQYAFPLRLMAQLEGQEAAVRAALAVLAGDVGRSAFEPERRKELLTWLAEQRHPEIGPAVQRFVTDVDEDVRYVAAEALMAQEGEVGRDVLFGRLTDPAEESTRLRHRVAYAFAQRGWPVDEAALAGRLPPGFSVENGRVRAR